VEIGQQRDLSTSKKVYIPHRASSNQHFKRTSALNGVNPAETGIMAAIWLALFFACSFAQLHGAVCPPAGFDSMADFSLGKYIQEDWYIQEQVRGSSREVHDPWN
jgi:hypothetical protein